MTVSTRFTNAFDSKLRSRGNRYYRQGRVVVHDATPNTIRAQVDGDTGLYDVTLDLANASSGVMSASCTCPYFDGGGRCKHIWATILEAEPRLTAVSFPSAGMLRLEDGLPFEDGDPNGDDYEGVSRKNDRLPTRPRRGSPPAAGHVQKPHWRTLLDAGKRMQSQVQSAPARGLPAKQRQAWFILDLTASQRLGGLAIELRQREARQNGELGVFKKLGIESPEFVSLRLLEQLYRHRSRSRFWPAVAAVVPVGSFSLGARG
jgi:hypothetical protein